MSFCRTSKTNKEEGMKKTLVIMLALFLAIPAISYAGSATSRWDLTIGGNIKFDVGWSDQSGAESGNDLWAEGVADRNPASGNTQLYNKYGTQLWGAGETGINFFVKGPDTWGAKTHAFILGDFTGFWGAAQATNGPPANYNTYNLLIAEMAFDWENTSLAFKVAPTFWGMVPTFANSASWNFGGYGGKGSAPIAPQVTVEERFTKNWIGGFGIVAPYNAVNGNQSPNGNVTGNANVNNYFRNPLPGFEGKFAYTSDSCGKVGPWQLLIQADGFYAQARQIWSNSPTGDIDSDTDVNQWLFDLKFLIPIIPEKNGNKTGAWYLDGSGFTASGMGLGGNWMANANGTFSTAPGSFGTTGPGWFTNAYQRPTAGSFGAATIWGLTGHTQFYFVDNVSVNAFAVWAEMANMSQAQKILNPNAIDRGYQTELNLMYDVSPAVRFTLAWGYTDDFFSFAVPGYKNNGSANTYKLAAYYFF